MKEPLRVAGDRDAHRFRSARGGGLVGRGLRSLFRLVLAIAAPRQITAAGGGGGDYQGDPGGTGDDPGGMPGAGDPQTGKRTAVWDYFLFDSTADLFGD